MQIIRICSDARRRSRDFGFRVASRNSLTFTQAEGLLYLVTWLKELNCRGHSSRRFDWSPISAFLHAPALIRHGRRRPLYLPSHFVANITANCILAADIRIMLARGTESPSRKYTLRTRLAAYFGLTSPGSKESPFINLYINNDVFCFISLVCAKVSLQSEFFNLLKRSVKEVCGAILYRCSVYSQTV